MDSKKIRTRQEFNSKPDNPKGKHYIIGLDIGYSGTKVFYETGYFVFPSYAKKLERGMLEIEDEKDILYKEDGSEDVYIVGYNAQNMIDANNTNDSEGELYSRKRYTDKRFKIICNTALALATKNKKDNKEIFIQTGLPSSYVEGDKGSMVKALCKKEKFHLKIGGQKDWRTYEIEVKPENVDVCPQPAGSLYSTLIKDNGQGVEKTKEILSSNVLVMDIGFGTFDFYGIKNKAIACKESTDEYGMKQLLNGVTKKIFEDTNEDLRVASIQKNLQTGLFTCINEEEMKSEEKSINPYIDEVNKTIFKEAMDKAKSVTSSFRDYKYLIVTGGTGEMWFNDISKWLEGMKTLTIIPGNVNDHLPMIYSNARGYYMLRYSKDQR